MAATVWKGRLNFGLVSIPVKLVRAARAEKIHMHHLQRATGSRVRQVFVSAEPVPVSPSTLSRPKEPEEIDEPEEIAEPDVLPVAKPVASREPDRQAPAELPAPPRNSGVASVSAGKRPVEESRPVPEPRTEPAQRTPPPLSRSDMVQGFEYEKDKYVEFEPEELQRIAPRNSADMQILEFVRFGEIDPVYLETSYYVSPDRGGEKPYALLFQTLKKTGYAAIGEFVMHRRDQIVIVRPGRHGLIAHTLFYEDEVKRENEFHAEISTVQPKEMDLAVKLVEALADKFQPEKFKDQYRERLREAIAEKVENRPVTAEKPAAIQAPVVDIMAALKESLSRARKPVARESRATTPETKAPRKQKTASRR